MLNGRGGIEADLTVSRLDEDRFGIVTGTAFGSHDREWVRRRLPDDGSVQVHDVTSQWACFGIWGPRARDVLQPLTPQSLAGEDFPYMTLRETTVAGAPVRALRVTYVGELGWELYTPSEYGLGLWQALWEAGAPHGMVAGGYRAIDSLRLEKGYRVWGADITPDVTPDEGSVGFAVKPGKAADFIGRDALVANGGRAAGSAASRSTIRCRSRSATSRCASAARSPAASRAAGTATRSGARSHTRTCPPIAAPGTEIEVEIFGRWVGGQVESEPLFDPEASASAPSRRAGCSNVHALETAGARAEREARDARVRHAPAGDGEPVRLGRGVELRPPGCEDRARAAQSPRTHCGGCAPERSTWRSRGRCSETAADQAKTASSASGWAMTRTGSCCRRVTVWRAGGS